MYTLFKRPSIFRSTAFIAVLLVGSIIGWIVPSFADQNLYRLIMIGLGILILASILALLMQAVISVLQYAFGFDLGGLGFTVGDLRRVSGTVGWPNTFGAYVAAVVCVPLALWMCGVGSKFKNLMLLLVCIVGFVPLVLTFSRGAWVGMLVGAIIIALLAARARWLSRGTTTRLLMLVAVIAVIGMFFFNQILARFSQDTLAVRGDLNRVAFNMIEAHPLLGIGLNTF